MTNVRFAFKFFHARIFIVEKEEGLGVGLSEVFGHDDGVSYVDFVVAV